MTAQQVDTTYQTSWYEVVEDSTLRQGDLFRGLVAFWPSRDLPALDAEPAGQAMEWLDCRQGDFIVASASCDVDQDDYPYVILCRVLPASSEVLRAAEGKALQQEQEVRRKGLVPSQFLLAPCDFMDPSFPLSIVQYKIHTLLPVEYLRKSATRKRLRLRHPHRERFGNWLGSNISRVGPENETLIPRIAGIFPAHVLRANDE